MKPFNLNALVGINIIFQGFYDRRNSHSTLHHHTPSCAGREIHSVVHARSIFAIDVVKAMNLPCWNGATGIIDKFYSQKVTLFCSWDFASVLKMLRITPIGPL